CIDTTIRRAAGLGYPVTLVSDAHTTHDKEHASGAKIRKHHNAMLPNISSFGVKIEAVEAHNLWA
ncbi:TPA: isochorismatase family protein, partial [Vibrio parahaemolyticus]|nr:isochorismatase family protein [Vibrio parahaemolyticus]